MTTKSKRGEKLAHLIALNSQTNGTRLRAIRTRVYEPLVFFLIYPKYRIRITTAVNKQFPGRGFSLLD